MDPSLAYTTTFLITGSHIDAEIARAKARRVYCSGCGDEITDSDHTDLVNGSLMHIQCAEAGADIEAEYELYF